MKKQPKYLPRKAVVVEPTFNLGNSYLSDYVPGVRKPKVGVYMSKKDQKEKMIKDYFETLKVTEENDIEEMDKVFELEEGKESAPKEKKPEKKKIVFGDEKGLQISQIHYYHKPEMRKKRSKCCLAFLSCLPTRPRFFR